MRSEGIYVSGGNGIIIEDTQISGCSDGIITGGTASMVIARTHISDCTFSGILLQDGFQASVRDTWIVANGIGNPVVWPEVPLGGVQLLDWASADLGSATDPGHNLIAGNGNGSIVNLTKHTIPAIYNRWDSPRPEIIVSTIWDESAAIANESNFIPGPVLFSPVWIPREDLFRFGNYWQSSDEKWDLDPNGSVGAEDLLKLLNEMK